MSKLIVHFDTATVIDINECVVVDTNDFDANDEAELEENEDYIFEIAERIGKAVDLKGETA